jgi:hypothetical protein
MLFPGYRPAVFNDIPITAIITMESMGTGTRYVFTALHRDEADFGENKATGWQEGRDRPRSARGACRGDEVVQEARRDTSPLLGRHFTSLARNPSVKMRRG